ncbi:MAG: hypothetical protein GXX91_17200 [Verrucomicrobiaceae bacterium]|nr:hypothetical protein [Verrucomicrobiaceae bacterium]
MKTTRFRRGTRFFLGSALVVPLSLGVWIGLQVAFQQPPAESFTLPAIPVDPMLAKADIATVADPVAPAPAARQNDPAAGTEPDVPTSRAGSADVLPALRDRVARDPENGELLLALADALFAADHPAEAWERVARTGRLRDPRFVSRLLRFSFAAARVDETLVMLDSVGDSLPAFSEADRLLLVRLHEEALRASREAGREFPTFLANP